MAKGAQAAMIYGNVYGHALRPHYGHTTIKQIKLAKKS